MSIQLVILLVGNGGREHALAWKLSSSPLVSQIYCVPGNGGTAHLSKTQNVPSVSASDFDALVSFAKTHNVNFLVPGPEQPLVDGIADHFLRQAPDIKVFGPSAAAARLEGSKAFSKDCMKRWGVPTAEYRNFTSYQDASTYLDTVQHKIVIKASGLAAGKGVILPGTKDEAHAALKEIMLDREFGDAGNEVVIEELLEGQELSVLTFCDGTTVKSLPAAQDHKRVFDNDQGPNTGGMGTYAPIPIETPELIDEITRTALEPTLKGARDEGFPFTGVLFTGFMLTVKGPKVLEYNVRFGDPETQSLLPLLKTDLAEVMLACTEGKLRDIKLEVGNKAAVTVVVAAGGYPGSYQKGVDMKLDPLPEDVVLFHAGTAISDNFLKTAGGRVIASTAVADTLPNAVKKAYQGVNCIHFDGMQFRKDIAARALQCFPSH